jgi:hypothetical protein
LNVETLSRLILQIGLRPGEASGEAVRFLFGGVVERERRDGLGDRLLRATGEGERDEDAERDGEREDELLLLLRLLLIDFFRLAPSLARLSKISSRSFLSSSSNS